MLIGHARVSTQDQTLARPAGRTYRGRLRADLNDTASGALSDRPGLAQARSHLRPGDTLVVWRLDRLGRSLRHLIETVTGLSAQSIGFRSLQEQIDTTTAGGKLVFHVFGALAEFERDLIGEQTRAGLEAARSRGRVGGPPRKFSAKQVAQLRTLAFDTSNSVQDICQTLGISRATYYRYLSPTTHKAR